MGRAFFRWNLVFKHNNSATEKHRRDNTSRGCETAPQGIFQRTNVEIRVAQRVRTGKREKNIFPDLLPCTYRSVYDDLTHTRTISNLTRSSPTNAASQLMNARVRSSAWNIYRHFFGSKPSILLASNHLEEMLLQKPFAGAVTVLTYKTQTDESTSHAAPHDRCAYGTILLRGQTRKASPGHRFRRGS